MRSGRSFESNFELSVESNLGLHWFCFTMLCDWSRKLAPLSQPIRCKTKTNRELVTRVFPRFRPVTCVYFELSLAPSNISFVLIGRCDSVLRVWKETTYNIPWRNCHDHIGWPSVTPLWKILATPLGLPHSIETRSNVDTLLYVRQSLECSHLFLSL